MSNQILSCTPEKFLDYELIDSGNFLKLERFGKYTTIRPEPQAVWTPKSSVEAWEKKADVRFIPKSSSSGSWQKFNAKMPDQWTIEYQIPNINKRIALRLGLTAFKHVGVFPEQAVNWQYIAESIQKINHKPVKFLNLFAYTGAASIAGKAAGADTTHLDSIKQVVNWASENQKLSGLSDIRWVVEDALKFVKREVKRGNIYQGIILDPPAYGHGPNGEKWKLEDQLNEMMTEVLKLLDPERHFFILNAYSLGYSSLILKNLITTNIKAQNLEIGELYLPDNSGHILPLGAFARFCKH